MTHLLPPRLIALWCLSLALAAWPAAQAGEPATDTRPVPPVITPSPLPAHWHHGVFMEIFVRAWRDSDGDGIGDLRGLTQSLDHLKDLGIRGIWLMPVTKNADGDHGYATTDFRDVAPEYGTLADFDELIAQAHRRGIGVVMDYVINHAAATHPMFQSAIGGPGQPFHDWFVWSETAPPGWEIWGKYPWYHTASRPWLYRGDLKQLPHPLPDARGFYFGTFGPHMPDFNFANPAVVAYHHDSLRFWLNRGLDGYRLDAVPHLLETDAVEWNDQPPSRVLTRQLQDLIKSYPQRYVVCEATAKPQDYGDPAVCGGAFAFGQVQHYVQAALGKAESVQKVAGYYRHASPTMATFVSNHDIFAGRRLWDQVGGDVASYKLAAAGYLLQPGTPFVYYGEEIGQAGVSTLPGDLPLRAPMSWTPDASTGGFTTGTPFRAVAPNVATHNVQMQRQDPGSILHFYKAMIGLRNSLPSIARGSYEAAFAQGLVAGWQRRLDGEHTVTLINYGKKPATVTVHELPGRAHLRSAWPPRAAAMRADRQGRLRITLPPQQLRVLVVRSAATAR
jgi:alpha-amylase